MLLENKDDFIAFQFDVEVAGGATVSDVKVIGDSDHMLSYRQLENGRWRVVCYSPTNSTFATNGTELLAVNAKDGITISNIRLTTAGYEEWRPADISATPTGIASMKQDLQMSVQSGLLYINSDREVTLQVYSLDGRICRTLNVSRGQNAFDGLPKGIYMINNKKIILR